VGAFRTPRRVRRTPTAGIRRAESARAPRADTRSALRASLDRPYQDTGDDRDAVVGTRPPWIAGGHTLRPAGLAGPPLRRHRGRWRRSGGRAPTRGSRADTRSALRASLDRPYEDTGAGGDEVAGAHRRGDRGRTHAPPCGLRWTAPTKTPETIETQSWERAHPGSRADTRSALRASLDRPYEDTVPGKMDRSMHRNARRLVRRTEEHESS